VPVEQEFLYLDDIHGDASELTALYAVFLHSP